MDLNKFYLLERTHVPGGIRERLVADPKIQKDPSKIQGMEFDNPFVAKEYAQNMARISSKTGCNGTIFIKRRGQIFGQVNF